MRETLGTGDSRSYNEGTGTGGAGLAAGLVGKGESFVVVRNNHAEKENAEAVKDQDAVKREFDGLGDRSSRVLGLGGSNTNEFGTEIGKSSIDHDGPESHELS